MSLRNSASVTLYIEQPFEMIQDGRHYVIYENMIF
jgi:hypothetical protein